MGTMIAITFNSSIPVRGASPLLHVMPQVSAPHRRTREGRADPLVMECHYSPGGPHLCFSYYAGILMGFGSEELFIARPALNDRRRL